MIITIVLLSLLVLVLLFQLLFIKRKINHLTAEIKRIRSTHTKENVTITLGNRTIEKLAIQLNNLIEDKLEAESEAIRTERALSEMITSMSHDLRTPLTAIIGYLQLLEDTDSKVDRNHYLAIIQARANQLHDLIQSFFALSTIQENKEPLQLESVQINKLIKQGALAYYDTFKQNKKSIDIHIPETTSTVIGNQVACNRIIENVLLNAIQYAAKEITIRLIENKDTVAFTVQNTVLSTEQLDPDRLFERLYTIDSSRQTHRGLGLPIVQQLMKQMEGRVFIEIENEVFSITCEWKKLKPATCSKFSNNQKRI